MWLGVLGPTVVRPSADADGAPSELKAAKHRALLAALALQPGRPMSADALVEAIWGLDAPPSAQATLHTYLSVVRRTLEPDLPPRAPSQYLVSSDLGYELRLPDGGLDVTEFSQVVADVHARLGSQVTAMAPAVDDPGAAAELLDRLDRALALWRGEPFADVDGLDRAVAERARLAEQRLLALEDRATLLLASGTPARAASELEALTASHPLRERLWTLLAVAQARTGRQADALATLDRLRRTLDDQLGIEPSPLVRDLQTAILRQEPLVSTTAAAPPGATRPTVPPSPRMEVVVPDWPLAGRDEELATLIALLEGAERGVPGFAVLIGEPGAGKSRLSLELCLRARDAGAHVLVGRCSQEEDAPPLWPWTSALGAEHTRVPDRADGEVGDHDAERFAVSDHIRQTLAALTTDQTVVLVLEDLHWADPSSLRVLRHLCAHVETGRLLVLCTWRRGARAEPLTETAEALARRHATHLELNGLTRDDAEDVLAAIAGGHVDDAVAAAVHARTEGNPFFLVEYARLARDQHRDLAAVIDRMPSTVSDVVRRRIKSLPAESAAALTAGAVIGREFDVALLAPALEVSELDALDLLEPARAIDLVQDLGADRFRFGHALVRDSAYDELTPSRRERMHATVAEIVAAAPDARTRASEVARHWAAAGSRYVHKAWRAAAYAANVAMAAHGTEEAAAHYRSALDLLARDPAATPRQRWDLLVGYADACRWSTRLLEMTEALDEAILIADEIGDPALVMGASSVAADGSVWQVRAYGFVNEDVVAAMRRALDRLPREDSEVRCRLLVLLAGELFYSWRPAEIDALVEEGLAMARRLGDRRLLLSVLTNGFSTRWRRETVEVRRAMAIEAIDLAREEGDPAAELLNRFLLATLRCGLGDLDGVEDEVAAIRASARERRLYFLEMATITFSQSWAAMRGDVDGILAGEARLRELDPLISLPQKADALQGALLVPQVWGHPMGEPEDFVQYVDHANVPIAPAMTTLLLRTGMDELAAQVWADASYDLGHDNWFAELHWSFGAEIALELGDAALGSQVYERLAPLRGQCVISGTGPAHGPADLYLACAAAAAGELALATEHADLAAQRCVDWNIPQVAQRLDDLRERYGF